MPFLAGDDDLGFLLSVTLINLAPLTLQISTQDEFEPFDKAIALEMDGTSDASKIAKQAIPVVKFRIDLFIFMVADSSTGMAQSQCLVTKKNS